MQSYRMQLKLPALSSLTQNRKWLPIGAAVVLAVVGVLGLFTDLFRSPRSIVAEALAKVGNPGETELRFIVDVRTNPDPSGQRFHHLNFRAGPGPLHLEGGVRPSLQFPFQLTLERRGVTVTFRGSTIIHEGAGYLRMTEMPAYGELGKTLEGRWLQVSDRRENAPQQALTADERTQFFRLLGASGVVETIDRGKSERVRTVGTRKYTLRLNDERLRVVLPELRAQASDEPGVAAVTQFLEGRLNEHRVDRVVLWIRPRTHQLMRARVELVPRSGEAGEQRIIVDATVLPRRGGDVPEAPSKAVRLKPETIQRLLSF